MCTVYEELYKLRNERLKTYNDIVTPHFHNVKDIQGL